jgi:hypothetical protein
MADQREVEEGARALWADPEVGAFLEEEVGPDPEGMQKVKRVSAIVIDAVNAMRLAITQGMAVVQPTPGATAAGAVPPQPPHPPPLAPGQAPPR